MKIESIILREIHMRLKSPFETSFGTVQQRRILLVEAIIDGISGWGEVTAGETPAYNAETTDTAWHVISDFIAPGIIGKKISRASEFPALMTQIRGHEMAKGGSLHERDDTPVADRRGPRSFKTARARRGAAANRTRGCARTR